MIASANIRRAILFAILLLCALIATIPLRVGVAGIAEGRLAARAVEGSIWSGTLRDPQFGSLRFGGVQVAMAKLPLLLGQAQLSLSGGGSVSVSASTLRVRDLNLRLDAGSALSPLPITMLDLQRVSVRFDRGVCVAANGRVRAETSAVVPGYSLPPTFLGEASCVQGDLLVSLTSQSGMETIQIRLNGQGRYGALLMIRPTDERTQAGLAAAGFQRVAGGYARRYSGTLN